ncbi:transmembrane protein 44 [Pseudophryne corroboree]|uniref:transmembrane protein 44 n=1 Tax=Pseudophryne corroboree TaxID=495146 RepID=UPI003081209D
MDKVRNVSVEKGRVPDDGLWSWDYLITCFADEKICVSFGLWLLSCLFWLTASSLQFYLRCKKKSSHEESVFWNVYGFFGSMCNTIGALLSKQLTIQVITGAYMALSDVVHFILTLFPACNFNYRVKSIRRNSRSRRQLKPILPALSFCMFISLAYYSLGVNDPPKVPHSPHRRLLGTALQENTDIVGFTLGIIAVLVSWTVRVPVITEVCKGMVFSVIQVWAILFSAMGSIMYAAAIMSHDRRPEYFVKAIPWFLISMGTAALDLSLLFLSCMMKNKQLQQLGLVMDVMLHSESCELLAEEEETKASKDSPKPTEKGENFSWAPLNMVPNRCLSNKVSLGRYVRLSIEQVQEDGIGEVRLPGDGQTNPGTTYNKEPLYYLDLPVYPPTRVTHSTTSPSSSSDISSNATDLEWDFEDLDQKWKKDSDVPSIQPNDSSVLNAMNDNRESQFPSTIWPTFKNLEAIANKKKKSRSVDLKKIGRK